MAKLNAAAIYSTCLAAGWPQVVGKPAKEQPAVIATAIALAESGGDTTSTNKNRNGTVDRGLFQINSVHRQFDGARLLSDPTYNAACALSLYNARGGRFTDWVVYNRGTYQTFMAQAIAVSNQKPSGPMSPADAAAAVGDAADAGALGPLAPLAGPLSAFASLAQTIATFSAAVLDAGWWKRVLWFAAGWLILAGALVLIFKDALAPATRLAIAGATGGASEVVAGAAEAATATTSTGGNTQ